MDTTTETAIRGMDQAIEAAEGWQVLYRKTVDEARSRIETQAITIECQSQEIALLRAELAETKVERDAAENRAAHLAKCLEDHEATICKMSARIFEFEEGRA